MTRSDEPLRAVVVEADGGSRGNPGPAGYGAVLKDADTGAVLAEDARRIGRATNNVAEYSGLVAGLRLAADLAPGADVEVRMDSKLVVEQMAGNWKIKHPDLRPLAQEATRLAPFGTTWTWIPRERNGHADRLANEALDGVRDGVTVAGDGRPEGPAPDSLVEELESPAAPARGWTPGTGGPPTTVVLLRHGVTAMTAEKRFSGGLGGSNPGLTDEGRAQVRDAADWLAPLGDEVAAVVSSPVRRTRESAEIVAERLGLPVREAPGFAEMEFGVWDGLTFAEVAERYREDLDAWLGSLTRRAGGSGRGAGESFRDVQARVLGALDDLVRDHAGSTVVVVSHVTPIKTLVAHALGAPLEAVFAMELSPASVTVLTFHPPEPDEGGGTGGDAGGGRPRASMRLYNARPPGGAAPSLAPATW